MDLRLYMQPLVDDLLIPNYAHPDDAGLDVYARETVVLDSLDRHSFALGFAVAPPTGHVVFVKPKSGLAVKHGLHTLAGVIDQGYRGEVAIVMVNLSREPVTINAGQKLAQLVLLPVVGADVCIVDRGNVLPQTSRGQRGFGSTGL